MEMNEKTNAAAVKYVFDFTDLLATGVTLSSVTDVTQQESGDTSTALTVATPTLATPRVSALVSGGTAGKLYVLSARAVASSGETLIVQAGVSILN